MSKLYQEVFFTMKILLENNPQYSFKVFQNNNSLEIISNELSEKKLMNYIKDLYYFSIEQYQYFENNIKFNLNKNKISLTLN